MKMINRYRFGPVLLLIFLLALFNRCKKDPVTDPVTPPAVSKVQFLGHRGSGSTHINPSIIDNTLQSVQKGMSTFPGVELDIQMSLDGTLWLFHDMDLSTKSCTPITPRTIILSHDKDISGINICTSLTKDRIYKLNEIISYWNQASTPFYISFHIKLDFPDDSLNNPAIGGEALYLAKLADNLAKVIPIVKSPGKILLEVHDATFNKKIHQLVPGIKVCLLKEVTFSKMIDDALVSGYDGISSSFTNSTLTSSEVSRAQSKGLIVQLWTPNTTSELTAAYNFLPDFIQTDNLNALNDLNLTAK